MSLPSGYLINRSKKNCIEILNAKLISMQTKTYVIIANAPYSNAAERSKKISLFPVANVHHITVGFT